MFSAGGVAAKLAAGTPETLRLVGEGGSSAVFEARLGGDSVALKVARAPAWDRVLADEAERLWLVRSPGVARLLEVGRVPPGSPGELGSHAGRAMLVLSWCEGPTAATLRVAARERERVALRVARDVGQALAALHATAVQHGDVKPANVIVGAERAYLVDLGLGDELGVRHPTGGTPRYLAPEVTTQAGSDGRARDLWALGLTLAELAFPQLTKESAPAQAFAALRGSSAVSAIVRALLAPSPRARPGAAWVVRRATQALDEPASHPGPERVEQAYLAVRRRELVRSARHRGLALEVGGVPGAWLAEALSTGQRIAELRGAPRVEPGPTLRELDAAGRARWLMALCGPQAGAWPQSAWSSDDALGRRLVELAAHTDLERLSLGELLGRRSVGRGTATRDAVELALRLGSGALDDELLEACEALASSDEASPPLVLATARALRLRGELGRALSLLDALPGAAATLERAETLRRAGDGEGARQLLLQLPTEALPDALAGRALALAARIALDGGDARGAADALVSAPRSAEVLEVAALAQLALGDVPGGREYAETGGVLAADEESRARLQGVLGTIEHAAGDGALALEHFVFAAEHAARAGALVEEATYLTGVAAAAADQGDVGRALGAARRGELLFTYLGRPAQAARAALSRASVLALLGAELQCRDAAGDAIERAREAGDARCRAFGHLTLADVLDPSSEAGEHAERASILLGEASRDDRLRVAARALRSGRTSADEIGSLDELALDAVVAIDARLDWWGARARVAARERGAPRPDRVLDELVGLVAARAPLGARAHAASDGARLALRMADVDRVRRFTQVVRDAVTTLGRHSPPELLPLLRDVPWAQVLSVPQEAALGAEQIADVEGLVRALGGRAELRPLLNQVLDALLLWTGVERGLLLIRAPGGRLVPRAARNLARSDLSGEQLALSRTLAERALERREPVMATDAVGELSELHQSVHALSLRSVLAVPLIARGDSIGVVYLDDRVRRGAFGPREIGWVRLIAAFAAVAIADARDQLLLRRAVRRARRAEARVEQQLARSQAELEFTARELSAERRGRGTRQAFAEIIGESPAVVELLRLLDRVAPADVPVLVLGESGSGKELVARALHRASARAPRSFVSENCGAIPETLLESTLFGHVKGAFTGASRARAGLFDVADGGTLFLDEIAEMSVGMQTKLLRVLQDGEVRPVGGERSHRVDVRVIGATHANLEERVATGRFREDLWYRLNVVSLRVPPLRERGADIALLARHFIREHAPGRDVALSAEALELLARHPFPGNVRQLENEIRRALVFADDRIEARHLSVELSGDGRQGPADPFDLKQRLDALSRQLVRDALARTAGNQTRAAQLLGLSRFGLQKMLRRLNMS